MRLGPQVYAPGVDWSDHDSQGLRATFGRRLAVCSQVFAESVGSFWLMGKENTIQEVNAKGQEESWIGEPEKMDVVQGIKTTVAFLNLRFKIKQQYCTNCLPIPFNICNKLDYKWD